MKIRLAQKKDARRISYLIRKNTEMVKENKYSSAQIRIWKKANTPKAIERSMRQRIIFCGFKNERLVGTIGLQGNEVVGLYIGYTQRKLGLGSKLLNHLENYARRQHIKALKLTATPAGKPFYTAHGYETLEAVEIEVMGVTFTETTMKKKIK